ncbi:SIR2 family protein [Micrococcus luteus]|uniref:SIR2 family protein n=1 Tax=Micrococcus luteus TaxID=1270 RepID=UPI00385D8A6B|nr:SIR2 family protein [Micrococcus luteus]
MSAAQLDYEAMSQLQEAARAEDLGLLLGAGASAAAGLPDWNTLALDLLTHSGAIDDRDTAQALLAGQDPALLAEAARAATDDWPELVRSVLYGIEGEPEPAVLHLAAAALAMQRDRTVRLLTMNFDQLLEKALRQALEEVGQERTVVSRAAGARQAKKDDLEVHHLHGLVGPVQGESQNVVLTLSDFTELATQTHPWQVSALREVLERGPLLMAGTSYRDQDLRQWLHKITQDTELPGKPTVFIARQGLDLDAQQFARVQGALVEQWSAIGVDAVLTHDHSDAAQALRELPYLTDPGYRAPAVRAKELLDSQYENFATLQSAHAEQLQTDLEQLRPHLGNEANLTLWLANGQGELVRWAVHDRVQRRPGELRHIPGGYDSPWIVGQALGRDDVMARELTQRSTTGRWRSIVAAPVTVKRPGGPVFTAAALSSATPDPLESHDLDAWRSALVEIVAHWGDRLSTIAENTP